MPGKHTLHVVLTEPLARYDCEKVAQGHHPAISDVVRASLRPPIELQDARAQADMATPAGEDQHGR